MKAIHNTAKGQDGDENVVYNHKDTKFWKQFTTQEGFNNLKIGCLQSQRYKILKAIHNKIFIQFL